jgi:hypothetical protein
MGGARHDSGGDAASNGIVAMERRLNAMVTAVCPQQPAGTKFRARL